MPKYNFHLGILRTSRRICNGNDNYDLIIVVKSALHGRQVRQSFRDFMQKETSLNPNFKVAYVFSVGQPRAAGGRTFIRDGHQFYFEGSASDLLQKSEGKSPADRMDIALEADKYDDILLSDYEDTWFNLTWKTVTNLRWLSAFCDKSRHDTFMLLDDDHRVNLSMVENFLQTTPKQVKRQSIFGFVVAGDNPSRDRTSKFYLAKWEYPMRIVPPYPRGFAQFIGADVVDDMAIASAYTKYNYFPEDIYLGILALKLNIPLKNAPHMRGEGVYVPDSQNARPVMVALDKYFESFPDN